MNPFTAFNFGRLIKTFLPGFAHLLAFLLIFDVCSHWVGLDGAFKHLTKISEVLLSLAAIPTCLILGILSNMITWVFVTEKLVRKPYDEAEPALRSLKKQFLASCIADLIDRRILTVTQAESVREHLDLKYLLMHKLDLTKVVYLEESYWYYMEFQLNMWLALAHGYLAFLIYWCSRAPSWLPPPAQWIASLLLVSIFVAWLSRVCLRTARLNYQRHSGGLISLYTAYLPDPKTSLANTDQPPWAPQ